MDLMKILDLDLEVALEITRDFWLNNFDHYFLRLSQGVLT